MPYNFNGEIFKEGQRLFIKVPFNMWDECGQRGNIPVKVTIDDYIYECKLLPKGSGIFYIPITKSDLKKIEVIKELKVSFELISGLSRINSNSPFSIERPIRKIDSIELVTPTKSGLCGQACIAMLSGISLNEIINLIGSQCSLSKVIEALDYFGIAHSNKMIYKLKRETTLPKCCIINTKGHLMIFFDGKYYDPSIGILHELDSSRITGFLEIFL